ncbi:MAG: translation initiation factor IF-2 [Alphaproteobacteria bacterium]
MTDSKEQERKTTLSLSGRGKLEMRKGIDPAQQVRQSFSHGRSKTVQVEVRRKRALDHGHSGDLADGGAAARRSAEGAKGKALGGGRARTLTQAEREAREKALRSALREEEARRTHAVGTAETVEIVAEVPVEAPERLDAEALRQRELDELRRIEEDERRKADEEKARLESAERERQQSDAQRRAAEKEDEDKRRQVADRTAKAAVAKVGGALAAEPDESAGPRGRRPGRGDIKRPIPTRSRGDQRRRGAKLTVSQALTGADGERTRSLAAMRRAREKERRDLAAQSQEKIIRDVIIPEAITVQELANRMAERGGDVIKALMKMGVMATINQTIDPDTADLLVTEFGHRVKRVADSDVEIGLKGEADSEGELQPRPPVVTVMGHVDHGKTSLLDALRETDVVSREAGGITQHIGAYQVTLQSGDRITFIDTPGHEAFTEMRARGANCTDLVVLVVAADDAVMPQTVEAIHHAKAAEVPVIVAINKCDLPDANPQRVRDGLLQHEIIVEEVGGDVLAVEVSAKTKSGLDKLEEAILLQAELLELKANPDRAAEGVVVEAKLERGRGTVATVLVKRGTLRVGDIFVTGSEWGRVRALIDDRGEQIDAAGPSLPVEALGLNGTPLAGDDLAVVESEARAREITEFRDRKKRDATQLASGRGTVDEMFSQIEAGEAKELPIVIKADVQGSVEAIASSLAKLAADNEEVAVQVLHAAVGGINESDVTLAGATGAMVIGFNVRANPQAREMARRDRLEIRYYSVIYDVIDDVRAALTGLLPPSLRERFIGNAEIREIFNITKVGKVAGCMVTDGVVKRGAGVRLLRDNVVVHEGKLKTLKRFKDEVKDVRESYECGMAFENYEDIKVGDIIEAFETEEVAREL